MQRVSVRDLVSVAGFWGQYGGIKVEMPQGAGSLDTVHILYDEASGFSATMKMFDYDPRAKIAERDYAGKGVWATRAPMLALSNPDPVLALPAKTVLQPMLLVRNTAAHPAKVSLGFHWRNSSTDGHVSLPEATLAPHETWKVDVGALQSRGTIPVDASWAQVTLTTNTAPDEVMAIAASYDETLHYGVQTPFSDQLISHLEGGEWKVDATHTSLIAAGNGGSKAVQTALTIFYDQGRKQYRLEKTIAADDQWWVDIGALVRNQTPDKNGQTLPADLTSGAYQLREVGSEPQNTLYEGKVITDKTYGHATYGCMVCCGYGGDAGAPFLVVDPTGVVVSGTASLDVYGTNACSGTSDILDTYFPTWSSSNTQVMTAANFSVKGIAVGSTKIQANATRMPTGQGQDQRVPCPMLPAQSNGNGNVVPSVAISGGPLIITAGAVTGTNSAKQYMLTAAGNPTGGTYSWSSSSNSVTISGGANTATVSVVGVSSGVSTITVSYIYNSQPAVTATQTVTSLKADNILVVDDSAFTSTNGCPSGLSAHGRFLTYSIQSTTTVITDAIMARENVPVIIDSCGRTIKTGAAGFNTLQVLPNNGYQFEDFIATCPASATQSCSFSVANQQWQQINADGSFTSIGTVGSMIEDSSKGATVAGHTPTQDLTGTDFH